MSSNMEEGKMKKWGVDRRPNQKERCMKKQRNDFYELKLKMFPKSMSIFFTTKIGGIRYKQ